MVKELQSYDEFKTLINGDKVVIIDFWATWCGPCKLIAPVFNKLAANPDNANIEFVKVDVDKLEDVAQEAGVKAMPTFMAYKKGEKIASMTGAVPAKLEALIKEATQAQ